MSWNPLQPRGIQRNAQSEAYAPDAWTDGDLRFRWTSEAGGVLEVSGIPGRPLPYQMSCPSPSEGRRWTFTLAGMLRQGRLPPEGVFRVSAQLPPPGSTEGRGGIVVGMYKGSGAEEWRTIRGHHILVRDGEPVNPPPWMKAGEHKDAPAAPAHHSDSLAAMGKVRDFLHGDPGASKLLKTPYKALVEGGACKTTGHCYAASEALYHHLGGKDAGWTPQSVQHEGGPHWFLKHKDGTVLDPTHDQFKTPVPVHQATGKGFLTKEPSKRAVAIMKAAGLGSMEKGAKPDGWITVRRGDAQKHAIPVEHVKASGRKIIVKIHSSHPAAKDGGKQTFKIDRAMHEAIAGKIREHAAAKDASGDGAGEKAATPSPKPAGPSVRERRWRPVAVAHGAKIRAEGSASLLGQKITSPADLAELAQVYRDGRYETLRYFWMKGDEVVGHTAVSSRLPSLASAIPFNVKPEYRDTWISGHMKSAGADGYYLLHNHPSGNPTPSEQDRLMTVSIAGRNPGFRGHVVINHGKYAIIKAEHSGNGSMSVETLVRETQRPPDIATAEHDLIGKRIRSHLDIIKLTEAMSAEKGWVSLIGISARGEVRAVTQISEELYRHPAKGKASLLRFGRETGSSGVISVLEGDPNKDRAMADERVRDGFLMDQIHRDGNKFQAWTESSFGMGKSGKSYGKDPEKASRKVKHEILTKGRSIVVILCKGKRITGPVAFLTNKEDGHVFPISASDPKAIAAMNTPRHREIVEKIHAETIDPKKKAVHAEHLAALKKMAGEATPGHGLVIKPNTEKSFRVTGNTKEHDAALAGLRGSNGDSYGSKQKNGDWVFSNKRRDVVESLLAKLGGKPQEGGAATAPEKPTAAQEATAAEPKTAPVSTSAQAPETPNEPKTIAAPEPKPEPVAEKEPAPQQEPEKKAEAETRIPQPSVEPSKKAKVGSAADKLPAAEGLDALVQTGDHIWGSRKDLAALTLNSAADLDHINYDDANQLIRKDKLVPTWDLETLRGMGHSPGTAHMVQALLASIAAKPKFATTEERKRYLDEVREVVASSKNIRTLGDFDRLLSEMREAQRRSGGYERVPGTDAFATQWDANKAALALRKEQRGKFFLRPTHQHGGYEIVQRTPARYDALGARFTSFIKRGRENETFHDAYATALTADGGWTNTSDKRGYSRTPELTAEQGWEFLKHRGTKAAEQKAAKAEKIAKAKARGQTERGWSGAKDVAGEVIRSGHGQDIGTANAERTRERFGLREVDYGQQGYMSQADREYHTKALEGALEDLAHTLGLPDKDLSFNGRLGVAMGARGRGKAAAHYEPGRHVINITKFRGGGSLAHEFGHALDNIIASHYVGKETKTGLPFLSGLHQHKDIPENIRSAVAGVLTAMNEHPNAEQARIAHRAHVENLRKAADELISRNNTLVREVEGLARKPATAEAHARNLAGQERRLGEARVRAEAADAEYAAKIAAGERIPRVLDERRAQERYTVESLTKAIERARAGGVQTAKDVARIEEARGQIEELRTDINRATRTLKDAQSVSPGGSFYLKSAAALGDYYRETPEMWARAWESFVEDKMGSNGRRNTYLVDGTDVDYETRYSFADGSKAQPYPRGEERKRINAAFEHLLETLHSSGALKKGLGLLFGAAPAKPRQIVVMFKGDVASMEPLATFSMSGRPRERQVGTEDDLRRRTLSIRQRSRAFIQRIHDGTQDPAKKAAHAARLEAYGPAIDAPPGRQRKTHPFVGSINFQGIPIAIENEKGTYREGIGRDGKPWRVKMNAHYGEIHGWGTLGTDGDKLDAYVGSDAEATHAYVIDQLHPDSGAFDEQKVMLGFPSEQAAKTAYLAQFDKPGFYGGIHPIPMDVLKAKIRDKGLRGQPISHGRPVVVLSSSSR